MNKALLEKLENARTNLATAEVAMDSAMRELVVSPRANKTAVTEPIMRAFESVRVARSVVAELLRILEETAVETPVAPRGS